MNKERKKKINNNKVHSYVGMSKSPILQVKGKVFQKRQILLYDGSCENTMTVC